MCYGSLDGLFNNMIAYESERKGHLAQQQTQTRIFPKNIRRKLEKELGLTSPRWSVSTATRESTFIKGVQGTRNQDQQKKRSILEGNLQVEKILSDAFVSSSAGWFGYGLE
ncbi:hypothetical protein Tco_1114215 [Tanacetum coccineum]|uniref:Uncharacterized protein n=1 Tax=Tanacetum coccineum TaxID=301880 RepID=A0ABQ5IUH1_9ASTR